MSEEQISKYYPPDFDPSKIPKLKLPKDRQYVVRLMAPFNMRCKTCGEYIYKGKKFNARKETVQNESYLGLPIFRFYIKCTRCLAEITFKTDPENTDYAMEHGATRNFQAEKLLEEEEKRLQKEREDEELNNPMKVLENRTKDSKLEMEVLENLQELKELNQRQAHVDFESMLQQYKDYEEQQKERELEEDEENCKKLKPSHAGHLATSSGSLVPSCAPPPDGTALLPNLLGDRSRRSRSLSWPGRREVADSSTSQLCCWSARQTGSWRQGPWRWETEEPMELWAAAAHLPFAWASYPLLPVTLSVRVSQTWISSCFWTAIPIMPDHWSC
uniref:Splicing factor YJU2 n=1 Tax=Podarcis muralis TaxID=64176 RepID=A0A670KE94_PODMU